MEVEIWPILVSNHIFQISCRFFVIFSLLSQFSPWCHPLIFQGIFCPALTLDQCGTENTLKNQGRAFLDYFCQALV